LATLALSVALACIALGVWQPAPQLLKNELDARGNSFSGLYDPSANVFVGSAQVLFATGAVYEGGMEENRFSGHGVLRGQEIDAEGNRHIWRFEGNFVNGRLEGQGSYKDHLGSYEGEFANSLPNGQGVYSSQSGWRYEGEFLAGMMTGKGTLYLADGSSSSGLFEDGLQMSTG